jgi:hypothetical protein
MFKVKKQYILHGSTIEISWELDSTLKNLFLYYRVSWLPWKNYTPISTSGNMALLVSDKKFEVKIEQLHFWGFKTLNYIKRNVHSIEVKNIESNLSLIENATIINHRKYHAEIASLFFNIKNKTIHAKYSTINPTIKSPSIKNILPIQ